MLPSAFRRKSDRCAIIGHRGVRGAEVENSLAALRRAAQEGADAVEVDVRETRDRAVVVFHDPDLWRMAGDRRQVADTDLHDLPLVRDFSALRTDEVAPQPIATLDEVIETCAELRLGLNVELKHDVPEPLEFSRRVSPALRAAARRIDLVVSSFHPGMLRAHRALVDCPHALLVHHSAYTWLSLRVAGALDFDGVHLQTALVREATMKPLLRRGFVNVWTTSDPREAELAFRLGADAVCTDEPARLLGERSARAP